MQSHLVQEKNLFPTPFWHFKMAEEFRLFYLNFFSQNYDFNNIQAEYNDANLFDNKSHLKEMNSLKNEVIQLIESQSRKNFQEASKFERAWLCGTGSNYSMKYHNHANSVISSVLYFHVDESRDLIFHDPRTNANRGYDSALLDLFNLKDFHWQPASGDIIIFPSFLYHSVLPYPMNSNRIAVALDFFSDN